MEIVRLTDSMERLLGRITVTCIPDLNIYLDTGSLRIMEFTDLLSGGKTPALVYGVSPLVYEDWGRVIRLLGEGRVGLLVTEGEARIIYEETGRKADAVALYGDDGFWRAVASDLGKRWGVRNHSVLVVSAVFARHLAGLRLFYGAGNVLPVLSSYRTGSASREELAEALFSAVSDVTVYSAYPVPFERWERLLQVLPVVNMTMLQQSLGDPARLLEIEEPPVMSLQLRLEETAKTLYETVRLLHPEAVKPIDEKTLLFKALF